MKKIIVSSILILIFGSYVLHKNAIGTTIPVDQKRSLLTSVSSQTSTSSPSYRDGQYIGTSADAYYGKVQVEVLVTGGKLAEVAFLTYPNQQMNSLRLNQDATPRLSEEAIAVQSANVDYVTGASLTSAAYIESLSAAIEQAKS